MKRILLAITTGTLLMLLISACDLLETEPTISVSSDQVTTTVSGMEAILISAYDRLRAENLYRYWIMGAPEILADNSQLHPINSGRFSGQAENQVGSHFTTGVWSTAYRLINEANIIIDAIERTETTQATRDRIKGEAFFLRGMAYHELHRVYAYEPNHPRLSTWGEGVIIRTTPTLGLSQADLRARSSVAEGYQLMESDFLQAIELLNGNDRGSVQFANLAAAHAGLARVYLYWERWAEAYEHAGLALENAIGNLTDYSSGANIFDMLPNPEAIFELSFDNTHGSSGSMNAVTSPPPGWFDLLPSDELLALYSEDDLRNNLFAVHTDGFPYILKYPGTVGQNTDNIVVFRIPEMMLIQAEAAYELGQESAAIGHLETLRAARGLEAYETALTGQALFDEIFDERRRELAFEGHRWFDLKRRAMEVPKPSSTFLSPIGFDDFRILAPLSSTQVENNPLLNQNPGY
ncbi:Starch-binding associating with outer membrane [Cyclonatronum proteinivorum]|uniref:Starch-binding associating with outer membrane n=1 Tax=Cyclonatronum proteinivorum TaxID=1457365 RepID=A0A345UN22_9BACT|nr:RagB/SusD family nutrient uptake outer membrane protein [Cyclonatronum proteinivorum]AXJ01874.1 Starch-binding associating with outer membrane [Cyclonatronum proteinivorum]